MIAFRSLGPDDVSSLGQPERGTLATVGVKVTPTTSFVHSVGSCPVAFSNRRCQ
jgi:hypothetical protein